MYFPQKLNLDLCKDFQKACKFVPGSCRAFLSDEHWKFYFNGSTTTTRRDGCSVPVLVRLDVLGTGGGVVEAGWVEHLELLVLQGAHRTHRVFKLGEVDIVTLESEPGNERKGMRTLTSRNPLKNKNATSCILPN